LAQWAVSRQVEQVELGGDGYTLVETRASVLHRNGHLQSLGKADDACFNGEECLHSAVTTRYIVLVQVVDWMATREGIVHVLPAVKAEPLPVEPRWGLDVKVYTKTASPACLGS
jgi:hypothetical protein